MSDCKLLHGDAAAMLRTLPDNSVHCCVTSPPYFGLRDYGTATWSGGDPACDHKPGNDNRVGRTGLQGGTKTAGHKAEGYGRVCGKCGATRTDDQIGLEPTPGHYVANLVEVFGEVWRVLRPDGVLWLNLGDSYANDAKWGGATGGKHVNGLHGEPVGRGKRDTGLKAKDLIGIPWRVAFALQDAGWTLRRDVIWHKTNPMPESVTDRPTNAHEYVFLLTKSARYFYDAQAVAEAAQVWPGQAGTFARNGAVSAHVLPGQSAAQHRADREDRVGSPTRNRRSVWSIATEPTPWAHFATMPSELAEICILAGTSAQGCCERCGAPWRRVVERTGEPDTTAKGSRFDAGKTAARDGGDRTQAGERFTKQTTGWTPTCECNAGVVPCTVLDPFAGSGTTLRVARRLGRNAIGIELNPAYVDLANRLLAETQPAMFGVGA